MTASGASQAVAERATPDSSSPTAASATATNGPWRVQVLQPSREITLRSRSRPRVAAPGIPDYRARALVLWPRLDPGKLRRTRGDVMRIARLVERRTSCSIEIIIGMLKRDSPE